MIEKLKAYKSMCKTGIVNMVVITAALGYFMAGSGIDSWWLFFLTLFGTGTSAAGSAVLNNYLERDLDALMDRTKKRAIPSGKVSPAEALAFGVILVVGGTSLLAWQVNLLCGFLALLTAFLYVVVYTPLKRVTWLNTFIGAIPGALPPMGGWAARTGNLDLGAWFLFLMLFIWQIPHFYAIAWMCKEDYKKAGFKMLPCLDPDGSKTALQIVIFSALLVPISLMPSIIGLSGSIYFLGVFTLGLWLLFCGCLMAESKSDRDAKSLFFATLIYFPIVLLLIVTDVTLSVNSVV